METALWLSSVEYLRHKWGWFLTLGILLVLLGIVALLMIPVATVAAVIVLGWLLVISGVFEAAHGFQVRGWGGMFLDLAAGALGVLVGLMVITHPVAGALAMTMLFATFFTVIGVFRIVAALRLRFNNWGWSVFDGAITLALGILLWVHWPSSGLWFMGLALGLSLLLRGWSYVMLALALHRPPGEAVRLREAA